MPEAAPVGLLNIFLIKVCAKEFDNLDNDASDSCEEVDIRLDSLLNVGKRCSVNAGL